MHICFRANHEISDEIEDITKRSWRRVFQPGIRRRAPLGRQYPLARLEKASVRRSLLRGGRYRPYSSLTLLSRPMAALADL